MNDKLNKEPHCDMFSSPEACPECGNDMNACNNICDICGCMWKEESGEKIIQKHGKLYCGK